MNYNEIMKKLLILFIVISLVGLFSVAMAVSDNGQGNSSDKRQNVSANGEDPSPTPETSPEPDDDDVDTEEDEDEDNDDEDNDKKFGAERRERARERMSAVASEVEQLLLTRDTGGIGQQVREIAQAQMEAQEELEEEVNSVDSRPGWMKRIVGPHFAAIRKAEKIIERNEERIEELEQLRFQLYDLEDRSKIQETIQAMEEQQEAIQERLDDEKKIKSVFGWFFKVFSR